MELPLLQTKGIRAYLEVASHSPLAVRKVELEQQFLDETKGLTEQEIQQQYPVEMITSLLKAL